MTLFLLLIAGSALRLYVYHAGPPTLLSERQYRSSIIARSYYFQMAEDVPEWRVAINGVSRERAGRLELPVSEFLTAIVYRAFGKELTWVPRVWSSIFWLIGGLALFQIGCRMVSPLGALFSTAFYLLAPSGAIAGVTFLPEPLMIMMLMLSLLTIVQYHDRPTARSLLVASIVSGLAILSKPFCLFMIVAVFAALTAYSLATSRPRLSFDFLTFVVLSMAIGASRYVYYAFIGGQLSANVGAGFLPYLFFTSSYWTEWLLRAVSTVGAASLVLALFGVSLLRRPSAVALSLGMGSGYFLFGLAYTYPMPISAHYHLQLLPLVALLLGPVSEVLWNRLSKSPTGRFRWIPVLLAFTVTCGLTLREVSRSVQAGRPVESRQVSEEVGRLVQHSERTVYIASYYGFPLEYQGELSGTYWPRNETNMDWFKDRRAGRMARVEEKPYLERLFGWLLRRPVKRHLSIEKRFQALDFEPDYFVITDMGAMERHHRDVKAYLEDNWTLVAGSDDFMVYRRPDL